MLPRLLIVIALIAFMQNVIAGSLIGGIGNLIPSMIGTCFGRFGFIQANRLIAPVNTVIRCTGLVIIGIVGVQNLNLSYWIFMGGTVLAIILIKFIKEPKRE